MDLVDPPHSPQDRGSGFGDEDDEPLKSPAKLPDDLPTSLDDRRNFDEYGGETEIYDAWQGKFCSCLPSRKDGSAIASGFTSTPPSRASVA